MDSDEIKPVEEAIANGTEGEDNEECGWCRWMKAGGCKTEFQVWLDCVDAVKAAGRDDVESCASVMGPLWDCMERHKDYYAPQLKATEERQKSTDNGKGGDDEDDELDGKDAD